MFKWDCKVCLKEFGPDSRQFRVWCYIPAGASRGAESVRIKSVECFDPIEGGLVPLRGRYDEQDSSAIPKASLQVLIESNPLGRADAPLIPYCEECFKEKFPLIQVPPRS